RSADCAASRRNHISCQLTPSPVCGKDILQTPRHLDQSASLRSVEACGHSRRDVKKAHSPLQKGLHGHLIRRIEDRRSRAAASKSLTRKANSRETIKIGRLERQRLKLDEVEALGRRFDPGRPSKSHGNGNPHVWTGHLGEHRPVLKRDKRMYDG